MVLFVDAAWKNCSKHIYEIIICLGAGIAYNLFVVNIYHKTKNMTNISTTQERCYG
jgi:hypothetical protein